MFKNTYTSDFPCWSKNDVGWHKKLVGLSSSQFAVCATRWNQFNKEQKRLLLNDYSNVLFFLPNAGKISIFGECSIDRVSLVLSPEIEEKFFSDNQMSGMWQIIYANCITAVQMVNLLRSEYETILNEIMSSYVVAVMQKVYDDEGQNKTEILSRNPIK